MTSNLITTQSLGLKKQGKEVLKDISIEIKANDFISLIGPNGAGKTMLIKCLMKLEKISSGKIVYKKGLKIGYVPQKLVIESNVPISLIDFIWLKEAKNQSTKENIERLMEQFKLESIQQKTLSQISGGQLQKVFLLKALIGEPDLLVLDEPEQNLDINSRIDFYALLNQIYQKHSLAIILASHELNFVMKSTKQVICLFSHICCSGEPELVVKNPEFIQLFGEKMAKMVSVYRHEEHDHSHQNF